MKWDNFTKPRVEGFACAAGKAQSIYWDGKTPGLGVRVTAAGAKSYIFEARVGGKTLRITIGSTQTYTVDAAQRLASGYKAQTDNEVDPRQVKASAEMAKAAADVALAATEIRDSVTLGDVWPEYIADRMATRENGWSDHHIRAHRQIIQTGGEKRVRSAKLTEPGPLSTLAKVRLVDLTAERIEEWAKVEAKTRPSSARLAWRMLKACLNWCAVHKKYSGIVVTNPTKSAKARESLGKPKKRHDVLQREQLPAWFAAVRQIGNPVFSAYLQALLLTGARREELAALKWDDVNFQWNSIKLKDKIKDFRMVPLTPFVAHLLAALPRRNAFVF